MRRWYQLSTWIPATTDITLVWSTWQNDAIQRHYSLSAQGVDLLIIIIETKYQTSRPIIILCKYQRLKDSTSTMQWPFYIINWCVLLAMNVWKRSLVWKVEDISKLSLHHLFIELSNQPFIPSLCFSPFTLKCNRRYFVCEKYSSDSEYMYNWVWNKLLWDINIPFIIFHLRLPQVTGQAGPRPRDLYSKVQPEKRLSQITFTCLATEINHERSQQKIVICLWTEKWSWVFTETPPWCGMRWCTETISPHYHKTEHINLCHLGPGHRQPLYKVAPVPSAAQPVTGWLPGAICHQHKPTHHKYVQR